MIVLRRATGYVGQAFGRPVVWEACLWGHVLWPWFSGPQSNGIGGVFKPLAKRVTLQPVEAALEGAALHVASGLCHFW
jgi:hypothetical protein